MSKNEQKDKRPLFDLESLIEFFVLWPAMLVGLIGILLQKIVNKIKDEIHK